MSAIKVLHLRDSGWVDGPGRTILESGKHYDPQRIEFHIGVLVPKGTASHPLLEGARQRGLNAHEIVDHGGFDLGVRRQIVNLVEQLRIDVLHTSDIRTNLFGSLCRLNPRVRRVATAHGWIANTPRRKILRLADKMVLRGFDAVIFVSGATRNLLPRWWLPDSRTHVLPNAVVMDERASAAPGSAAADGRGEVVNLLNVGRLSPEKGQELLLEVFAGLSREYPMLRLHFAGAGPLEEQLRAQAARMGIADRVAFLGYVNDMPALYARSDLVIQSSLTEGMPNVILEAALWGRPIVASAVGGTGEIIQHGHSGWLVEAGSRTELERGMRQFLERPAEFREMALRAREHVRAHHSFAARTRRMTEIYEALIKCPP